MLTDAEMQRLLDMRVCAATGGYSLEDILALDAALPKLVEEVRRLRAEIKEWNEYVAVMCGGNPKEESHD